MPIRQTGELNKMLINFSTNNGLPEGEGKQGVGRLGKGGQFYSEGRTEL